MEAAEISDMTCEEDTIAITKTRELLSTTQLLMREIKELLDLCTSAGPSKKRRRRMIKQEGQANIEEDGETLIIDGFRFESAVSREGLRRLRPPADGAGGGGGLSDGRPRGLTAQSQRGRGTGRRNRGKRRAKK